MSDEIRDHDDEVVQKSLKDLMLHFDAVTIFVTRQDGDSTIGGAWGRGNWYSRYGQVCEWIENGGSMKPPIYEDNDEDSSSEA